VTGLGYAWRAAADDWHVAYLMGDPPGPRSFQEACGAPTQSFPNTCTYDVQNFVPLGAVASGAQVRSFFTRVTSQARGHSMCYGGCNCYWQFDSVVPIAGSLEVAWLADSELRHAVIAQSAIYGGSQPVVGPAGQIHIVLADSAGGLQYVEIGAIRSPSPTATETPIDPTPTRTPTARRHGSSGGCAIGAPARWGANALLLAAAAIFASMSRQARRRGAARALQLVVWTQRRR
jgi:hypothetical protein